MLSPETSFDHKLDYMAKKSKKPDTGHGGKRPGAGRKKTNHVGAHLRIETKTLSQIDVLRDGQRISRSSIVIMAVGEKYERFMAYRKEQHQLFEAREERRKLEYASKVVAELRSIESLVSACKSFKRLTGWYYLTSDHSVEILDPETKQWLQQIKGKIWARLQERYELNSPDELQQIGWHHMKLKRR
jgi:hypothetical protein